ncbi:MAG: CDP-alcohol phosphatidyltransferase family protein [Clostridia bacterium]|nr:CDP-alcohol phosphatidyltransferase family protein [Clostridia bacterium]
MNKFIKYVPNILSASRIIVASFLFMFNDFYDPLFLGLYMFCAFTDFLDGRIARKYHCESKLGAALDSIGDGMTYLPLLKILIVQKLIPSWLVIWILADLALAFVGAFIALGRFKKFFIPHTYVGKLLGVVVFVLPLMVQFVPVNVWLIAIAFNATINVAEIIFIQSVSKEPEDVLSVFHVNKNVKKELVEAEKN